MHVEFKNWKSAEAKVEAALAAEGKAYEAFRLNINKKPAWRNAEWDVVFSRQNAEKAFDAWLAVRP